MKLLTILLLILSAASFAAMPMSQLDTAETQWISVGTIDATAASSDVALTATERSYKNTKALANGVGYEINQGMNAIEVQFKLLTNNADVDIDIYAARNKSDSLTKIATLDIIAGQQVEFVNGTATSFLFADTINVASTSLFLKDCYATTPGTDQRAAFAVDVCGYQKILFHGYGTFDEDCVIELSGF